MTTKKRLPAIRMGYLPQTTRDDVFLWHNHVMHTAGTGHGARGFRCHWEHKPVDYRQFMRCECGWSGLPHYSIRAFGKQRSVTAANLKAALRHDVDDGGPIF
jgi:hypothetical protein